METTSIPAEQSQNIVGYIAPDKMPGVIVKEDKPFMEVGGVLWPVIAATKHNGRMIPILDIPTAEDKKREENASNEQ